MKNYIVQRAEPFSGRRKGQTRPPKPAMIRIDGILFTSAKPNFEDEANAINRAAETIVPKEEKP